MNHSTVEDILDQFREFYNDVLGKKEPELVDRVSDVVDALEELEDYLR